MTSTTAMRVVFKQPRTRWSTFGRGQRVRDRSFRGSLTGSCRQRRPHSRHPQQIAGGHGELELGIDASKASKHGLPQSPDGLAPTEVFLDSLADNLAQAVSGMASRPPIDGAAAATRVVASDVRCDAAFAAGVHEVRRVIGLVGADAAT